MSRWPSDWAHQELPLVLGLSERGVAWLPPGPVASAPWQTSDWPPGTDGPAGFNAWVGQYAPQMKIKRQTVQLCLAPGLARHWVQTVPQGVTSLTELRAVAMARARQLWGAIPGGWMVTGDWQHEGAFLCTAVPLAWQTAWDALAEHWGQAALHTPLLLAQKWERRRWPSDGWVTLAVAQHLYVQQRSAGRIVSLRTVRWPAASTHETLQQLAHQEARREMLRAGHPPDAKHQFVLCGKDTARATMVTPAAALDATQALQAAWCARQWMVEAAHAS